MKHYRIRVNGRGGDVYIALATREQYEFWNDEEKLKEAGFEDPDFEYTNTALGDYMLEKEELAEDELSEYAVPDQARFNVLRWWHLYDYLSYGPTLESAYMIVEEVDSGAPFGAKALKTVWEGPVTEFQKEQGGSVLKFDRPIVDENGNPPGYLFYAMDVMRGQFLDMVISTETEIDFGKIKFYTHQYLNRDRLISTVNYTASNEQEDGPDDFGLDAFGKGCFMEVLKYDKEVHG